MKFNSIPSFLFLAIALVLGKTLTRRNRSSQWHEGEKWERLLRIYDDIATEMYRGCDSRLLPPTKYGSTQIHACGDPKNPPVLFFHGIATNSLMFGDWLVPPLSDEYYAVAVDTMCDMGRSVPPDADPSQCPKSQREVAEWMREVIDQLEITKPASIIGYSFGSFLAACLAQTFPDIVDKLVMIAPAGVFAPIEGAWMLRAIAFGVMYSVAPTKRAADWLHTWFFTYMMPNAATIENMTHHELREATSAVGTPQITVPADSFSVDTLRDMASVNPTLLIMGEEETVTNATIAADAATRAGVQLKLYPKSGHLLMIEYPREPVIEVIASFLGNSNDE